MSDAVGGGATAGSGTSSGPRRHTSGFDAVGQSSDPTPGDVDEMGRLEQRYREIAENAQTALDKVKQGGSLDNGLGKAMDALNKQMKDLPDKLQKTVTSYTDAADVFKNWAPVLRQTQDTVDQAMDQALGASGAANQTIAPLPANPTDDQKNQQKQQQDAASQAQGQVDSAKQMASQAKDQHDSSASNFAHQLDVAASEAIPSRNIFQKIADFFANNPIFKLILTALGAIAGFLLPPLGVILAGGIALGLAAIDIGSGKGFGDIALDLLGGIPGVGLLGKGAKLVGEGIEAGGKAGKFAAGVGKVAGKLGDIGGDAGKVKSAGGPLKIIGKTVAHGAADSAEEAAKEKIEGKPLDAGAIVGAGLGGIVSKGGKIAEDAGAFGTTVAKKAVGAGAAGATSSVTEGVTGSAIDGKPLDAGALIGGAVTGGVLGAGGSALRNKLGGGSGGNTADEGIPTKTTSRGPAGTTPPVPPQKPAGLKGNAIGGSGTAPAKAAPPPVPPKPAGLQSGGAPAKAAPPPVPPKPAGLQSGGAAPAAAPPPPPPPPSAPSATPSGSGAAAGAAAVGGAGALGVAAKKAGVVKPPPPPPPTAGHPVQPTGTIPGTKNVAQLPNPGTQTLPSAQSDKVAPLTGLDVNGVNHTPVIRQTNEPLFRNDSRDPSTVFQNGFQPKNTANSALFPFLNQPSRSGFVSTTNAPHIGANEGKFGGFKFHIQAPGGIDANATFGKHSPFDDEKEITFPGGIRTQNIAGAQPVQGGKLGTFVPNPHFNPTAPNPIDPTPKPFQDPGTGPLPGGATGVPSHVTT